MISAAETIGLLTDPDSFESFGDRLRTTDPLGFSDTKPYADRLVTARSTTGCDESVTAGRARIGGTSVALLVSEYGFIGGSIGAATGELIARTFDRATDEQLPVVAVTRSGGTRMQEGNYGFSQITKTVTALARFRRTGLPYIAYLAHPTIGGVLASWGSQAHLTFAEPEALIGFAGPRSVEAATGSRLPDDVQTAENLAAHGLVDAVVPLTELRDRLSPLLHALRAQVGGSQTTTPVVASRRNGDAWESVVATRNAQRAGTRELLTEVASECTYLHGDGQGGPDDPSILTVLCLLGGIPTMVIGHDKTVDTAGAETNADGYRKARRAIKLAGELDLPIVTLVDTPGAELSRDSEEDGLAHHLAGCLTDLLTVPSPVLCVLLGQGGGGGALTLLGGDRTLAAQRSWLAPISPEASSAILYGNTEGSAAMARAQHITAPDLCALGLADHVITDPDDCLTATAHSVTWHLSALIAQPETDRLNARHNRYRRIGNTSIHSDATSGI